MVSFRREKYVPRGGPDGGDGGRGGDVVLVADPSIRVLDGLRRRKTVEADSGGPGRSAKRHGRDGADLEVRVPAGTVVWTRDGRQLADLTVPGMRVVVAKAGGGGRGNARMATSTRRAPRFAERGLPGERVRLRLELRMLAEAGLVGLPNAGKSSLLRAVSSARPKVGAYPFTTLEPYIGVADVDHESIAVADIPGLIEGAHEGAGLGISFLRHIQRTRVLVHVVDLAADGVDGQIDVVRGELEAFGHGLGEKPWLAALNKIDLPEAAERAPDAAKALRGRGVEAYPISAATGEGVEALVRAVWRLVQEERARAAAETAERPEPPVLRPRPRVAVVREDGVFRVVGSAPEQAAAKLGTEPLEARLELVRRLRRMGVVSALERAGVAEGDRVRIGDADLEWPL